MKKIKSSYPRRREMLTASFEPLSDDDFRKFVAAGVAVPGRQGGSFFVSKWRDGPGMDVDAFLDGLRAEGSTMMVRKFESDVNIRVRRSSDSVSKRKRLSGG